MIPTKQRRLVVLGAGGVLGRHILRHAPHAVGYDHQSCDITDRADVARALDGAHMVVNCAAFTNVDKAEAERGAAFAVNAEGAENVGRVARLHGVRAIHVSTDFVFDGVKTTPYDERDVPRPLGAYGASKHEGETRFLEVLPDGVVARVQGLYGVGGTNFSSKLADLIEAKKALKLDDERKVQPTWAGAAAKQLLAILDSDFHGVAHVSCEGAATWAEFAQRLCDKLRLPATFERVSSAALQAPAARPPNCLFDHRALREVGLFTMPSWQDAQDQYLADR